MISLPATRSLSDTMANGTVGNTATQSGASIEAPNTPTGKKASIKDAINTAGNNIKLLLTGDKTKSSSDQYWFWGIAVLVSIAVAFGIYYMVNRKGKK